MTEKKRAHVYCGSYAGCKRVFYFILPWANVKHEWAVTIDSNAYDPRGELIAMYMRTNKSTWRYYLIKWLQFYCYDTHVMHVLPRGTYVAQTRLSCNVMRVPTRRDYLFKTKSTTRKNSIFNVVRFLPFYSTDQMKGQQDTSLIKVTRLFNKTLS